MVGSPEQFVKEYFAMVDAARGTKEWRDWKPSTAFNSRIDAEFDKVFGKAKSMPKTSKIENI